jgi:hypothetical protein
MSKRSARVAPAACRFEPVHQRLVVGIKAQPDDVHRGACKRNRNLGAGQIGQAQCKGGITRALLAADFIVIGQCPQLDTIGLGPSGQSLGLQRAVGHARMTVQVGVGPGGGS